MGLFSFLALCAGASGTLAWGQRTSVQRLQPNILFIVLDDVGTDKLRVYGESESATYSQAPFCGPKTAPLPYPRTPTLDALAAGQFPGLLGGGLRFGRAYASPLCSQARACLQTGRYGFRTGIGVVDDGLSLRHRMPNEEVLIAELLRDGIPKPVSRSSPRRYRSGAFGKWHLSALPVCDSVLASDFTHPADNGYHTFQGTMTNVGTGLSNPGDHYNWTKVATSSGLTQLTRYQVGPTFLVEPFEFSAECTTPGILIQQTTYDEDSFSASVTRQDATQWIRGQKEPFFAWVSFNAPHFPYQVPPFSLLSPETQATLSDIGNCKGPYCAGQEAGEDSPCGTSTCGDNTGCAALQQRLFFDAMLEAVDTEIANLLNGMTPGQRANTMVFVLGDNGTPGAIIDGFLHDPSHGKSTLFELSVRVPFIASGYLVPEGEHQSDALVHAVDFWQTFGDIGGASTALAAPLEPLDSVSFEQVLRDPNAASARDEIFCQGFVLPGEYAPTDWGPYEASCTDPFIPGVFFWEPKNTGAHGRSLTDGQYKLILLQVQAGLEVSPPGMPDIPPAYSEELYDILADPGETTDLIPQLGANPTLQAAYDTLRTRLTALSGF